MNTHAQWKEGDWCFYHYTLCQVKTVEPDGRVTRLDDGIMQRHTDYHTDRRSGMFPLSDKGNRVSTEFRHQVVFMRDRRHAMFPNWDVIAPWFVQEWETIMRGPEDGIGTLERLWTFVARIKELDRTYNTLEKLGLKVFES